MAIANRRGRAVIQFPLNATYAEPTIMWRLRNPEDGRRAFSIIIPLGPKATATWFSQGIRQESRDFATWHDAIYWLEKKRVTLRLHGWHVEELSDEQPDSTPSS
jgi:hypothetical protein